MDKIKVKQPVYGLKGDMMPDCTTPEEHMGITDADLAGN